MKTIHAFLLTALLCQSSLLFADTHSQTEGDFFVKTYQNAQTHATTGLEIFTKQPKHNVFFGILCNSQTPLPMIEIILQNDDTLSDTNKLMNAQIHFQTQQPNFKNMNGILLAKSTFEADSNTIRLEITGKKTLTQMSQNYQTLLQTLAKNQQVTVQLSHHTLGKFTYTFTLKGLNKILAQHGHVCW